MAGWLRGGGGFNSPRNNVAYPPNATILPPEQLGPGPKITSIALCSPSRLHAGAMTTPLPFVRHRIGRTRLQHRRSRNGCLTCKRRKVRCNEQKPQCYHCQRLSLECVWKDETTSPPRRRSQDLVEKDQSEHSIICSASGSLSASAMDSTWLSAPPPPAPPLDDVVVDLATDHIQDFSLFPDFYLGDIGDSIAPGEMALLDAPFSTDLSGNRPSELELAGQDGGSPDMDGSSRFHTPRILDPVDNGPICASLRAQLDDMANSSSMVRSAMTAFAAIQSGTDEPRSEEYRKSYDAASNELSQRFRHRGDKGAMTSSAELGHVLTTIFFLTYINVCLRFPSHASNIPSLF